MQIDAAVMRMVLGVEFHWGLLLRYSAARTIGW